MPDTIIVGANQITYLYDTAGNKLKKTAGSANSHYQGNVLEISGQDIILTGEGRAVYANSQWNYEYDLKDHLGNTRVSFGVDTTRAVPLQYKDYYPFGMEMAQWYGIEGTPTKYLYNGKELQDEYGLDWYDYGRRFYDPQIARFHTQDRFAEKYFDLNPYQYGGNNPILYLDLNGDSIVAITRQDNQILIENSPLEEGGENFTNTISFANGVKDSHVTDKSAGAVNDAMVEISDTEVTVSSGYRSPEKQAQVMYDNLESKGVKHQKDLYGSSGDKVIDAYVDAKGKTDKQGYKLNDVSGIKSTMLSKIKAIGPGRVSKHSSNPKVYNVFDIAPSSVSNIKTFQKTLRGDKRVTRIIPYPDDLGIHIEIKQ